MPAQFAIPIIRFRDATSLDLKYELTEWKTFTSSTYWRKSGTARLVVNFESIPVAYTAIGTVIEFRFGEITFSGPLLRRTLSKKADGRVWTLEYANYLWWLNTRVTFPAAGDDHLDPGLVSAEQYIRNMINTQLLNPTLANRRVHFNAVLETIHSPQLGSMVRLPSRYHIVANEIEKACIGGNVGIVADLNASKQVEFGVRAPENRVKGTTNAIIYSTDLQTVLSLDYTEDTKRIRNGIVTLGRGEGAARNRVIRRDETSITNIGYREAGLDARHATVTESLNSIGDEELERLTEIGNTYTVTLPENTSGTLERPGRLVTVEIPEINLSEDVLIHAVRASMDSNQGMQIKCDLGPPHETTADVIARVNERAHIAEFA